MSNNHISKWNTYRFKFRIERITTSIIFPRHSLNISQFRILQQSINDSQYDCLICNGKEEEEGKDKEHQNGKGKVDRKNYTCPRAEIVDRGIVVVEV